MSDYREYSKVIKVEHGFFERRMFLKLDCGHEVYRYKKVAPKLVRCEFCHRPAWFPAAQQSVHPTGGTVPPLVEFLANPENYPTAEQGSRPTTSG